MLVAVVDVVYLEKALTAPEASCWASLWVMMMSLMASTNLGWVGWGRVRQKVGEDEDRDR